VSLEFPIDPDAPVSSPSLEFTVDPDAPVSSEKIICFRDVFSIKMYRFEMF